MNHINLNKIIKESINKIICESKLNKITFISYGTNDYDENNIKPININDKNTVIMSMIRNKPIGGLWASPINSKNSWGKFCDENDFNLKTLSKHFLFKLNDSANVYIIDNFKDLKNISTATNYYGQKCINLPYLIQNYDGIYVTENASYLRNDYENICGLSSWDVESICIWNKNAITHIEENAFEHAEIDNFAGNLNQIYDEFNEPNQDRIKLQMDNDYIKYGNQNIKPNMETLFNGQHPSILSQLHGNNKKTKLAKKFNGTIKSGMK